MAKTRTKTKAKFEPKAKAISRRALRQRINHYFRRAENYDLGITQVIKATQSIGATAVFGGMLRDLLLYGEEGFKSDIDLVVAVDGKMLTATLAKFSPTQTAFGGLRVEYKHSKIDIWSLQDTWAFRNGLVQGQDFNDLVKTTFFNWDAIVYVLGEGKLLLGRNYLESIEKRVLDINLEPNPNPVGMLKRTFSRVAKDHATLAPRLAEYAARVLRENNEDNFVQESIKSNEQFLTFWSSLNRHLRESPQTPFALAAQLSFWSNSK